MIINAMALPAQRRIFVCGEQCNVFMLNETTEKTARHDTRVLYCCAETPNEYIGMILLPQTFLYSCRLERCIYSKENAQLDCQSTIQVTNNELAVLWHHNAKGKNTNAVVAKRRSSQDICSLV